MSNTVQRGFLKAIGRGNSPLSFSFTLVEGKEDKEGEAASRKQGDGRPCLHVFTSIMLTTPISPLPAKNKILDGFAQIPLPDEARVGGPPPPPPPMELQQSPNCSDIMQRFVLRPSLPWGTQLQNSDFSQNNRR